MGNYWSGKPICDEHQIEGHLEKMIYMSYMKRHEYIV